MALKDLFRRQKIAQTLRETSTFLKEDTHQRLPLVYGTDEYFLTEDALWAGYSVPPKDYGFLSLKARRDMFSSATQWFFSFPSAEGNSGQLLIVNHTKTAEQWRDGLIEKQRKLADQENRKLEPGFPIYVDLSRQAIEAQDFFSRDVFLFTRLGNREGSVSGLTGILASLGRSLTSGFGIDESQPLAEEKVANLERAQQFTAKMTRTWMNPLPIKRSRLEWICRYIDTLGQPTPDPAPVDRQDWGIGQWQTVMSSFTRVVDLGKGSNNDRIRALQFVNSRGEGMNYVAFMPVSVIPDRLDPLANWLYLASTMVFPVDVSLRFEIIDPDRATKELNRPIDRAEGQAMEEIESGRAPDDTTQSQREQLEAVKLETRTGKKPMAIWQCVMAVYAHDPDSLKENITALKVAYEGMSFQLETPPLDQRPLFYQMFPGSEILVTDWIQRTNVNYLAASAPWVDSAVGSGVENPALYQGYTVVSQGMTAKKGAPVFFDLISTIDEKGRAGNEVIVGGPGGGKRLPLSTLIPTPTGFTVLGAMKVGDKGLDEKGNPCSITALSPIELAPESFILTFDNGATQKACAEHRWFTLTRKARNTPRVELNDDLSVRLAHIIQYEDPESTISLEGACALGGTRALWDEASKKVRQTSGEFPLVPLACVALGLVSGNLATTPSGHGLGSVKTTRDIANSVISGGKSNHSIPVAQAINYAPLAHPLPSDPYEMGRHIEDGIPDPFFVASFSERLALLQGIMDYLGKIKRRGVVELTTASQYVAYRTRTLIASLGMKVRTYKHEGSYTLTFSPHLQVFREGVLATELAPYIDNVHKRNLNHYITSVEETDPVPMRCITVDSDSHLYLMGTQFIPTHNTVSRGLKSAHENALKGVTQYIWDPKGDFVPLYTNAADLLINQERVRLIELGTDKSSVSLDAFAIAEYDPEAGIDDRASSAQGQLNKLLLGLQIDGMQGIIGDIVDQIMRRAQVKGDAPKMADVFPLLHEWVDGNINIPSLSAQRREYYSDVARQFLRQLTTVRSHSLGAVLFADPAKGSLEVLSGVTTIFSAINLKEVTTPEQTVNENLDVVISRVIQEAMLSFVRSLVTRLPDIVTKHLYFDEWHVVKRSDAAERLLDWAQRMGRSKRTAISRLSQSADDVTGGSVNAIWAGKTESNEEARASCRLLQIEPSEGNIATLNNLDKGQFIFRDPDGRIAHVQIDFWDEEVLEIFNTQAAHKAERQARLRAQNQG